MPYYRSLFERHGVEPGRVKTVADLARIPVTSRRDLQEAPLSDRLARGSDPGRLITHRTSGSTGQPVLVHRTWLEERITTIFQLRAHRDHGLRVRDMRVRLVLPRVLDERSKELLREFGRLNIDDVRKELGIRTP